MNHWDGWRSDLNGAGLGASRAQPRGRTLRVSSVGYEIDRATGFIDRTWAAAHPAVQPIAYAKEQYPGYYMSLDYATLVELFPGAAVTVKPTSGDYYGQKTWFLGGNSVLGQRTTVDYGAALTKNGFVLATEDGPIKIDPYLFQQGSTVSSLVADQKQSQSERDAGLAENCGPFINITPTQARIQFARSSALGVPVSIRTCLDTLSKKKKTTSGGGVVYGPYVPGGGGGGGNNTVTPWWGGEGGGTTKTCSAGHTKPVSGKPLVCDPGYAVDTDDAGCQQCVPSCPTGWVPPDQFTGTCPLGEGLYTNAASGCVKCGVAKNCFVPGSQPLPCPAPLMLANRGNYVCCVQSATLPGVVPETPPTTTEPVPAAPTEAPVQASIFVKGGLALAAAALIYSAFYKKKDKGTSSSLKSRKVGF